MALLKNSLTYVWLFLVGTTLVSWWLGTRTGAASIDASTVSLSFAVTVGIILIAVVKTRFVILHFMEVRHGPAWLRWTCDTWLAVLAVMVIALFRYSV